MECCWTVECKEVGVSGEEGRLWAGHANGGSRGSGDKLCYGAFSFSARNGIPHGHVSLIRCCQQVRLVSLELVTVHAGFVQKIAICCHYWLFH